MANLEALLAYQDKETEKKQKEAELRNTPARQQFAKLRKVLKDQQTLLNTLTEQMQNRMALVKKLTERVAKLEDQTEVESDEFQVISGDEESVAAEMTELKGDVNRLSREIDNALRDIKAAMADLETAVSKYKETRQSAAKNKKEYDTLRLTCEEEQQSFAAVLGVYDEALAEIAKKIDGQTLAKYNRARMHNENPVVPVENSKCSGCNMSLPVVTLRRLVAPGSIIECENCGRILYAPVQKQAE